MSYKVFDRMMSVPTYYGSAKKEHIMSLDADRLDQQIFPFDHGRLDYFNDGASSYITSTNINSRLSRDLAMDIKNPRNELPKSNNDTRTIDVIPNLNPIQPDMSTPEDYEASVAINMYKQARQNHRKEDNFFVDKKAQKKDKANGVGSSVGPSKGNKGPGKAREADTYDAEPLKSLGILELFSHEGSAAGLHMNRLATDEDDAYLNSVESVQAF